MRSKRSRRFAVENTAQVFFEWRSLADGEDPSLFAGVIDHRGNVSGAENRGGVRQRSEAIIDLNEAFRVARQPGLSQPGRRRGASDPDDLVEALFKARFRPQTAFRDFRDAGAAMHLDVALGQYSLELIAHSLVVGGQNIACAAE